MLTHIIIGGGAAGFFAAITCAKYNSADRVILLEKTRVPLAKVRISGGGRCNVTHSCFDPKELVRFYPRGSQELLSAFTQFQPRNTLQWFEERGVELKTESDGRIFPQTDSSETIIDCLSREAHDTGVEILLERGVEKIESQNGGFILSLSNGETIEADRLLIATGSSTKIFPLLESLGHTITPLVPSLFTFNIPNSPFHDLAGTSVSDATLRLTGAALESSGPLLITHWGLSGPAVLKLSAWGARYLHEAAYREDISINWLSSYSEDELRRVIWEFKESHLSKMIGTDSPFELSRQLWKRLIELSQLDPDQKWSAFSKKQLVKLIEQLRNSKLALEGKTTYKQEFVTCGGVNLKEVDFRTMESRICPHLFFAGEVLNIDGITGGFNFQNAWTTGWIAGRSMGSKLPHSLKEK